MWKKKKALLGNHIKPDCSYCTRGSGFDGAFVCELGRCLEPDGSCRKFVYDPLRRAPQVPPALLEFDPDDFKL